MKKLALVILMSLTGSNLYAQSSNEVTKDFEVTNFACFIDSVGALKGALDLIVFEASSWCESLNGELNRIQDNNLEVTVHNKSPSRGGCRGDVTVRSRFTCYVDTNINL